MIMCQRQWRLYTTYKKLNQEACIEETYLILDIAVANHPYLLTLKLLEHFKLIFAIISIFKETYFSINNLKFL